MKFYPIINFNTSDNLSPLEVSKIYYCIIDAIDTWVCHNHNKSYLQTVELSLASSGIFQNLFELKAKLHERGLDIAFGSLVSIDQIINLCKSYQCLLDDEIEVLAPAYDDTIADFIQDDSFASQHFKYIPGIYNKEDFDELTSKLPELDTVKIFPIDISDPTSFLKTLQAPYPELKQARFQPRIHTISDKLAKQYKVYDKFTANDSVYLVSSPRDYQKIRNKFMVNNKLKLLLKPQQRSIHELIQYIRSIKPKIKIVATGFNNAEQYPDLAVDAIATRLFKAIILDYTQWCYRPRSSKRADDRRVKSISTR